MSDPNLMANKVPLGRAYEILEDGETFGSYTILRCLAYDMLGSLYLAQNSQNGQRETLFVFPSLVSQDSGFHDRFVNQTKKLCSLKHANLINFSQPLIVQNSYCLVGEPFEGLNIPDHLMLLTGSQLSTTENREAVNLPPAQVTPILEQVLTGLAYAQDCKVMHLNLNPTKILRSSFGEVKVYGYHFLAILGQELFEMLVSAGIPPLKLDPNRSFLGTTDILSPEARLRKSLEYRSDIYALGVDTHWLLTGRKPVSPYKTPSTLAPGIEQGWDAFTLRCLQRKPEDRYTTAALALADLRSVAQLTPLVQAQPLELLLAPETAADKRKAAKPAPSPKKEKPAKLPKAPRKAGKPLSSIQRLFFIGVPSLIAVALGAYLYVMLMTTEDELQGDVLAVRAGEGHTPKLRLTISPRNALVTITPGKNFFQVTDGELPLNIAKGDYTIEVESPNFLKSRIPYTVGNEPDRMFVNLEPAWAVVDFASVPGATITAKPESGNLMQLGVADAKGALHVTRGLAAGNYTFTAAKDDYAPAELAGEKLDLAKTYRLTLKPVAKPANITLTSDPAGVTVRMGQRVLGQTPLTTRDIPVETDVELTLEKPGYQSVARTLQVMPNISETIDLGNLSAQMGEIALNLTLAGNAPSAEELRDAKILIDNRPYPASIRRLPNTLTGPHTASFQHSDYAPQEKSFTVTQGNVVTVSADLQPKPAQLSIRPNPAVPFAVYLNEIPAQPGVGGMYLLPPNQPVRVRVEARNFAGAAHEFKLGPNRSETWEVPLQVIAPPKAGNNYDVPYLGIALNWIPPGKFEMGSPSAEIERKTSEGPATTVTFPLGFWAGRYEVTQGQYQMVMNDNPSEFGRSPPDPAHFPVEKVSWLKAREFARLVNDREQAAGRVPAGYEYRLPTEAEWEYLARAGAVTPFTFGDRADPAKANFKGSYPTASSGSQITSGESSSGTKPIGSYQPNAWGLFDVQGNVAEWVLDAYKSRLPGGEITAPALQAGDDNARREYRGGGWKDYARDARLAWRDLGQGIRPDTVSNAIGFRLVLAPKIPPTASGN